MNHTESSSSPAPDEATLLRLLVNAALGFAIFAVEPDGTILTWNPGVQNLIGYEEDEFIGRNCAMIFTPEDRANHAPEQERETARREGQALDERWHLRKDGTRFWGSGFMHALRDDNGNLRGFAKILRDMTEEKQREEELEARVRERTAAYKKLQQRLLTAEENERRRISRELHDQTGQYLATLGMEIGRLERSVATFAAHLVPQAEATAESAISSFARLGILVDSLSQDIHRIAVDLRPTSLDDLGLVATLRFYVAEWSERTGTRMETEFVGLDDSSPERRLPSELATALFRIIQEALTNAAKYAVPGGATKVGIALQRVDGYVLVTIEDDGPGFDVEEARSRGRLGLVGMQERAELLGGTLEVESSPGSGTIIYARIPLPAAESA